MDVTIGGITYHLKIPEWDELRDSVSRIEATVDELLRLAEAEHSTIKINIKWRVKRLED